MEIYPGEENMFMECLDSFVNIVARRRSLNHVIKLLRKQREILFDPGLIEDLFEGQASESCDEALKHMEESRCMEKMAISIENLNLFIDSDDLIQILECLPPKLFQSIVMGVGFGFDNGTMAERMNVKPNTVKVYKSQAISISRERAGKNGRE